MSAPVRRTVAAAVLLTLILSAGASAQRNDLSVGYGGMQLIQTNSGVGNISSPGQLNRDSPINTFGRVGGSYTFTFGGTLQSASGGGGGFDRRSATPRLGGLAGGLDKPRPGGADNRLGDAPAFGTTTGFRQSAGFGGIERNNVPRFGTPTFGLNQMPLGARLGRGTTADLGLANAFRANPASTLPSNGKGLSPRFMLDRQLLTSARSPLARAAVGPARDEFTIAADAAAKQSTVPVAETIASRPPDPVLESGMDELSPGERMRERVRRTTAFAIQRGDELFKAGRLQEAKASYELAKGLRSDDPTADVRLFLVSSFLFEHNEATVSLKFAIAKAESLQQLRVDVESVLPTKEDLNIFVRSLAERAGRSDVGTALQIKYAFLAWLADDPISARRVTALAAESKDSGPEIHKFLAWLDAEVGAAAPATK